MASFCRLPSIVREQVLDLLLQSFCAGISVHDAGN